MIWLSAEFWGRAQRNLAAAILVCALNFPRTMAIPFVLVASINLPLIFTPTACWLDQSSEAAT